MSITMYDEILDNFENAYGDYLYGEKDYYDSAAPVDSLLNEEEQAQEQSLFDSFDSFDSADRQSPCENAESAASEVQSTHVDDTIKERGERRPDHPAEAFEPATKLKDEPERREESDNQDEPDRFAETYKPKTLLKTIPSDELMTRCYPRKRYLVDTLLTPGLTVLAGPPKVGKSWLVLNLCMQIAKGEPFLGMKTTQGSVLYIALEDNNRRLQDRVYHITDEGSTNLHIATECAPIGERLDEELADFISHYRDTRLVVIDTFQKIREQGREMSYANDYVEVSFLKKIADLLDIAIVLVHHTRKQGDSDYMNEISGTNGIAGSADTLMVLKKENRGARSAILSCTGRDIEDREMKLYLDRETCVWELKSDSRGENDFTLPEEIVQLCGYMKKVGRFEGSASELTSLLASRGKHEWNAARFGKLMTQYRYELEDSGVIFETTRSAKQRKLIVSYEKKYDKNVR